MSTKPVDISPTSTGLLFFFLLLFLFELKLPVQLSCDYCDLGYNVYRRLFIHSHSSYLTSWQKKQTTSDCLLHSYYKKKLRMWNSLGLLSCSNASVILACYLANPLSQVWVSTACTYRLLFSIRPFQLASRSLGQARASVVLGSMLFRMYSRR